ncbi:MAG TPA: AcvB/VirJ family lysyl-phosphatidylglycerol hydrolase, partial [Saprospiraceae bacterium]|nr:AcvB/VirJ family lysyl-phosphatidylglycerol hydrolase [Saprospiraceae bacterium]
VKAASTMPDISGLPVVRIKASAGQSDYFAIMFSGDGGWSKFDQGVCDEMANHGVSTLGLNCLKYIRHTKTPEQMTTDLSRLIEWGKTEFGKQKVILIGYSCGANLTPFAYNRLNDSIKAKVQYVALLSPEKMADFRFHFYNWANSNSHKAQPVKPELEKMRNKPALFIYGEEENNAWCSDLMNGMFQLKKLPGGHHFNQDTRSVAAEILHFNL